MWWLGLTGELDPESSECFIAESPRLSNWGKELAIFEDCFGTYSDVVCDILVSNELVYRSKMRNWCWYEECAVIYHMPPYIRQNTESPPVLNSIY